jgi:hypothetical protein
MPLPIATYILRLLGLSQAIHNWQSTLAKLESTRREKIALYADAIAATLARASAAFATLERDPSDGRALREAIRELGRITGYVEDIVTALDTHLDGRKLAGVKRRLDQLAEKHPIRLAVHRKDGARIDGLLEAEGYFRALADGLRA